MGYVVVPEEARDREIEGVGRPGGAKSSVTSIVQYLAVLYSTYFMSFATKLQKISVSSLGEVHRRRKGTSSSKESGETLNGGRSLPKE